MLLALLNNDNSIAYYFIVDVLIASLWLIERRDFLMFSRNP